MDCLTAALMAARENAVSIGTGIRYQFGGY